MHLLVSGEKTTPDLHGTPDCIFGRDTHAIAQKVLRGKCHRALYFRRRKSPTFSVVSRRAINQAFGHVVVGTLLITINSVRRSRRVALTGRGFGTPVSTVGDVLLAGALGPNLQSTALYQPATNSFAPASKGATMNNSAVNTATRLDNGKLLMAGGCCVVIPQPAKFLGFRSTDLYDPVINIFAPPALTATMHDGRALGAVAVVLLDGRVFIAGVTGLIRND